MFTLEQQNYAYNAYIESIKFLHQPKSLLHPQFSSNCAMYVATTENLVAYLEKLNVEGKSVLTVTGSGDQLINLALNGARRVDNFDVNQNAYFMTQLKLAALQVLSYEEFLNFFAVCEDEEIEYFSLIARQKKIGENEQAFDFKTYLKIKPFLDETSTFYWNLLYEEFQFDGSALAHSQLFYSATKKSMIASNEYLESSQKYQLARLRMRDVEFNFMECNILDIHNLEDTYDVMLLSNIYDYLTGEFYAYMSEDDFVTYIKEQAATRLNEGGKIAVCYQYNYRQNNNINASLIERILGKNYTLERRPPLDNMKKIIVPSTIKEYRESGNKDCVYVYEKGKVK